MKRNIAGIQSHGSFCIPANFICAEGISFIIMKYLVGNKAFDTTKNDFKLVEKEEMPVSENGTIDPSKSIVFKVFYKQNGGVSLLE